MKKQDTSIYFLHETRFRSKDIHRLESERMEKIFHAKGNEKKGGIATLISDKKRLKQRQ